VTDRTVAARIASGMLRFARRLAVFLAVMVALVAAAAVVSLPVWLFASRLPRVFTAVVLVGCLGAVVLSVVFRVRKRRMS
jgi:hypothetical protein